uniref:Uncharacterized protein n=1 Tax=Panagrolaimus superbus TaxID=310955 RepID=A0A914XZL6_9BILA
MDNFKITGPLPVVNAVWRLLIRGLKSYTVTPDGEKRICLCVLRRLNRRFKRNLNAALEVKEFYLNQRDLYASHLLSPDVFPAKFCEVCERAYFEEMTYSED